MNNEFFPKGYLGSTKAELDHQVGNKITPVKLGLSGDFEFDDMPTMIAASKTSFIAGLQRAVDEQFPVFGGVTHHDLTEAIELAENTDWSKPNQLKKLTKLCGELRKDK